MTHLIRNVQLSKILVGMQALLINQSQVVENLSRILEPGWKWCLEAVIQGNIKPPLNLSSIIKN